MSNPFSRLFQRFRPAAAPTEAVPAPAPPAPEPDPFDPVWDWLTGPTPAQPAPLAPEHAELVESLVPKVVEHFSSHKPDLIAFPAIAFQVIDLMHDPDLEMNRLLRVITPDPAIVSRILNVANSVLYSRGAEVQDLRAAAQRIGMRGVTEIAVGVAGRSLFDASVRAEYLMFGDRLRSLFLDAMAIAFGSSQFAFEQHVGRADRAFQAGMFHDIGKTLALQSLATLDSSGATPGLLPAPVVDAVLERVHVEAGCALIRAWHLPAHLAEHCQHHHDKEVPDTLEHTDLHTLRLASGLYRLVLDPASADRLDETRQSLRALGLSRRATQRFHADLLEQAQRVAVMFPA